MNRMIRALFAPTLAIGFFSAVQTRAEVIIQYFETEWDEIYARLPELAEYGFEGIWHPSPAKSPVAGVFQNGYGGNVGYNLFDRFDLGDTPQRGTLETRYGTRGSLRQMVDNAHQSGIKIYPDIVFNHSGNGPHIDTYPSIRYYDFHGWDDGGQPLGFKRADRMGQWTPDNGCAGTMWQELVGLYELANGLSRTNALPPYGYSDDLDGDGMSNGDEMIAGTSPNNQWEFLQIEINMLGAVPEILWNSISNKNYQVETSDSLIPPSWQAISALKTAYSNQQVEIDSNASQTTSRFYRVQIKL